MRWQLRRGVLQPPYSVRPGSPWWRAVNERLLRDGCEAVALSGGLAGPASSSTVEHWMSFIDDPTARAWYRAHNAASSPATWTTATLPEAENAAERFFMNVVLCRVLYTHALVAAPRLSLGWLRPLAPFLGDPRLGMTGIFLQLSRVLPAEYPLTRTSGPICRELGFGRLLDYGVIVPRLQQLYEWSAWELGVPELLDCVRDGALTYAWPFEERDVWRAPDSVFVRVVHQMLPPGREETAMADDSAAQKRRRIRWVQRYLVNPPAKVAVWCGVVPGFVLVETTGRRSGKRRRNVVGMKADDDVGWVVAEHGRHAGYVNNLEANPDVRVRMHRRWRAAVSSRSWTTTIPGLASTRSVDARTKPRSGASEPTCSPSSSGSNPTDDPDRVRFVVVRRYEHPLVAPQLGQAWQLPARCMMSPQTWQSTVSDARDARACPGVSGGADGGVMIDADGAWSSSGSSA